MSIVDAAALIEAFAQLGICFCGVMFVLEVAEGSRSKPTCLNLRSASTNRLPADEKIAA